MFALVLAAVLLTLVVSWFAADVLFRLTRPRASRPSRADGASERDDGLPTD
jgi:hypothetical protein